MHIPYISAYAGNTLLSVNFPILYARGRRQFAPRSRRPQTPNNCVLVQTRSYLGLISMTRHHRVNPEELHQKTSEILEFPAEMFELISSLAVRRPCSRTKDVNPQPRLEPLCRPEGMKGLVDIWARGTTGRRIQYLRILNPASYFYINWCVNVTFFSILC